MSSRAERMGNFLFALGLILLLTFLSINILYIFNKKFSLSKFIKTILKQFLFFMLMKLLPFKVANLSKSSKVSGALVQTQPHIISHLNASIFSSSLQRIAFVFYDNFSDHICL